MAYNKDTYKRIKEQRRRAQQRKRRKNFIRALCVAVIIAVVSGTVALTKNIKKGAQKPITASQATFEPIKAVTPVPSPTAAPERDTKNTSSSRLDKRYYSNCAFIGNSFIKSIKDMGIVSNAAFFTEEKLSVVKSYMEGSAVDKKTPSSAAPVKDREGNFSIISSIGEDSGYERIFVMFGEEECKDATAANFRVAYNAFLKYLKSEQPGAAIYLFSIPPIAQTAEESSSDYNTKRIREFNNYIKNLAEANNAKYVDLFNALAEEDGYLDEAAASDGIHFNDEEYYIKALVYTQQNY